MGGPCAGIILSIEPSDAQLVEIDSLLQQGRVASMRRTRIRLTTKGGDWNFDGLQCSGGSPRTRRTIAASGGALWRFDRFRRSPEASDNERSHHQAPRERTEQLVRSQCVDRFAAWEPKCSRRMSGSISARVAKNEPLLSTNCQTGSDFAGIRKLLKLPWRLCATSRVDCWA
jgi:hypothetical protein